MRYVVVVMIGLFGVGTAQAGLSSPSRQGGAEGYGSKACRPPLRSLAGTCVRTCPAGYRDTGRVCRFRSIRH